MGKKVLIVDDSETAQLINSRCLYIAYDRECIINYADDGIKAFSAINDLCFDLIISDINMPNMNGIELLKKLKNMPNASQIPFILVTSLSEDSRDRELIDMGCNYIIKKPMNPIKMQKALNHINF